VSSVSCGRRAADRVRGGAAPTTAIVALALAAVLILTPAAALAQAIPPPPPNPGDAPARAPAAKPRPAAPKRATCPRCGYMCEAGWHHCAACGWDMTKLVGDAEERRLSDIARASVRLVVGGRRNRHITAFPFGGEGLLLTNARYLIGADDTRLRVLTYNNQEYPASIVGYDLPTGVGVIKASIPGSPAIEVAPTTPTTSDAAWAVCYPVSYEDDTVRFLPVSLHRGHVTATGQTGTSYVSFENLLRTDHAIEDGCTGGPLVDARGRFAGMILGAREDGLTYAQPLAGLDAIVATLQRNERPKRPYFGIGIVTPDDRRRTKFGLDPATAQPLVAYVIAGSPAEKAGVKAGDLLTAVDGKPITAVREAGPLLLAAPPGGSAVTLTLKRAGADVQVSVPPGPRPDRVMLEPIDELEETLEATVKESPGGSGKPAGLILADVVRGGRGERERYHNGDVVQTVDNKTIKTPRAYNDYIRTKYKDMFSDKPPADRLYASTYLVNFEVRTTEDEKVTREYVNGFPDILAPPVY
jgi:S1-C subfamily serine protease